MDPPRHSVDGGSSSEDSGSSLEHAVSSPEHLGSYSESGGSSSGSSSGGSHSSSERGSSSGGSDSSSSERGSSSGGNSSSSERGVSSFVVGRGSTSADGGSSSSHGGSSSSRGRCDGEVLPIEIMREVFMRLPCRNIVQLQVLNSSYDCLFQEPSFINSHRGYSPSFLLLHTSFQPSLHHDRGFLTHYSTFDFPMAVVGFVLEVVAVCDGLVCIRSRGVVFLCNPAIRRSVFVFVIPEFRKTSRVMFFRYGLGFDSSTNDYKLVRINVDIQSIQVNISPSCSVFRVRDRVWINVQTPPCTLCMERMYSIHSWNSACPRNGVVVQGFLHWAAKRWINSAWYYFILFFNFVSETFDELLLPDTLAHSDFDRGVFVIESGNEKPLTVYHIDRTAKSLTFTCGIWCMLDYGVVESWTRLFTFEFHPLYIRSPAFEMGLDDIILTDPPLALLHRNNGELLFAVELQSRKYLYSLNIDNGSFLRLPIEVDEERGPSFSYAGYYSESLVLLDQHFDPY